MSRRTLGKIFVITTGEIFLFGLMFIATYPLPMWTTISSFIVMNMFAVGMYLWRPDV